MHGTYSEHDREYKAYEQLKNIVKQNPDTEIYISLDSYEFIHVNVDMDDNLVYDDQFYYL